MQFIHKTIARCSEMARNVMPYLVKKGAVRRVFGECRGSAHNGLVHAVAVIRHAHSPLVHIHLLLQQSACTGKAKMLVKEQGSKDGHVRTLKKILMATYSWPGQGSYCCTLEPPQQGLSATDGITDVFLGLFDCVYLHTFLH